MIEPTWPYAQVLFTRLDVVSGQLSINRNITAACWRDDSPLDAEGFARTLTLLDDIRTLHAELCGLRKAHST